MPIVTRRYQLMGPSAEALTRYVSSTAAVTATFPGPIVDISIDDSEAGAVQALDDYMASIDYEFSPLALALTTAIIPYAPLSSISFGETLYCLFGAVFSDEQRANWPAPRTASLQSLQIDVTSNTLTTSAQFIVRVAIGIGAFADTSLVINVAAGTTGLFNASGNVMLNEGDRVSLRVKTSGASGEIEFTGSVECV